MYNPKKFIMSGEVKTKKKFAKGKGKKAEEAVAEDNGITLSAGNYRVICIKK